MAKGTFSTIDRLGKPTSLSIGVDDAITDPDVQGLANALDAVIIGADLKATVTVANIVDVGSQVPPNDVNANRGNKWLFRTQVAAEDGKVYDNELGTADSAQLPSAAVDFLDLTQGVGATLKSTWETAWRSPQGNTGVLLTVQQVNLALN